MTLLSDVTVVTRTPYLSVSFLEFGTQFQSDFFAISPHPREHFRPGFCALNEPKMFSRNLDFVTMADKLQARVNTVECHSPDYEVTWAYHERHTNVFMSAGISRPFL